MKKNILIVEDEAIIAGSLKQCFQALNYNILKIVSQGQDAVASVDKNNPDIIFMDISLLGEMDGYQAMRAIRQSSPVPVIYLTGGDQDQLDKKAKGTKPYDYLIKPFDFDVLESKVKKIIEEQKAALKPF